jgi:hypothetical protein
VARYRREADEVQEEETRAKSYLFDLVSAWERWQAAKADLNEFLFEASEPLMPERFGSVEELIRYNQQRAAYEHERSEFIQQRKAFEKQYDEALGSVMTILPVGASISFRVPEDLGRVGGYEGNHYDISNKETEEGPRLSVTKLEG